MSVIARVSTTREPAKRQQEFEHLKKVLVNTLSEIEEKLDKVRGKTDEIH